MKIIVPAIAFACILSLVLFSPVLAQETQGPVAQVPLAPISVPNVPFPAVVLPNVAFSPVVVPGLPVEQVVLPNIAFSVEIPNIAYPQ